MVKICVSVPARTMGSTLETIRGLSRADLIELRLDYAVEQLDLAKLRKSTSTPLVATARIQAHGGRWALGEFERQKLLLSAAEMGYDYIDVEADSCHLGALAGKLHATGTTVIVSRHYLDRTPTLEEMLEAHHNAEDAGADIVKIIGTAKKAEDNLPCLEYVARAPGSVGFAMGFHGVPSRVLSPLMGGAWTYASAGEAVAPGQLTLESLRETFRLMGVE